MNRMTVQLKDLSLRLSQIWSRSSCPSQNQTCSSSILHGSFMKMHVHTEEQADTITLMLPAIKNHHKVHLLQYALCLPPSPASSLGRILMSGREENKSVVRLVMHCGISGGSSMEVGSGSLEGHQSHCLHVNCFWKKSQSLSFVSVSWCCKYDEANGSHSTRAPWLSL